jgi:hypothetical protein
MPRMKDYSYAVMLIPALYVLRDMSRRSVAIDYVAIGAVLMLIGQPQQTSVPGMSAAITLLQAYLPLLEAMAILAYLLCVLNRGPEASGPERPISPRLLR